MKIELRTNILVFQFYKLVQIYFNYIYLNLKEIEQKEKEEKEEEEGEENETVAYSAVWISNSVSRGHWEAATILILPGGLFVSFVSRFAGLFRVPRGFSFLVVYLIPLLGRYCACPGRRPTTTCHSRFSLPFSFLFSWTETPSTREINVRGKRFTISSLRQSTHVTYFHWSDLSYGGFFED